MAERPVECSHCKKAIKVVYKEIVGESIVTTEMCSDCPILEQRLHGQLLTKDEARTTGEKTASLVCENCHTSLETVKTGSPLGCSSCYAVFSDVIVANLIEANQIPPQLQKTLATKKAQQIHVGKIPNQAFTVLPSSKLTALNEALGEAIKRENYEQAAQLRDQIKTLMENPNEGKS